MTPLCDSMLLIMSLLTRKITSTHSASVVTTPSIRCVEIDFIEESFWVTTTTFIVLKGIRSFEPLRHGVRSLELSRGGVVSIISDGLTSSCKVGMANELHHKTIFESKFFFTVTNELLECPELGFMVSMDVAISR